MEVGRPQHGVGAIVGACGEARGDVQRPAHRDHQVRKIAAHARPALQRLHRRGVAVGRVGRELHLLLHPFHDGLHPPIAHGQGPELLHGQLRELIGLAIPAGVQVAQHLKRQVGHGHFGQLVGLGKIVRHVHAGRVADLELAGQGPQAHVAGARARVGVDLGKHRLAQGQALGAHGLAGGVRGMDVEDEVSAFGANLIAQVYLQFDAGHVWCLGSSQAHPLGVGPHHARPGPVAGLIAQKRPGKWPGHPWCAQ